RELPRLSIEHHHANVADAEEHVLEAGGAGIGKRDDGLRGDALGQIRFPRARRADHEHAAMDFTAHLFELPHAPQQRHDPRRQLQHLRVPLVVVEADAGLARHYPVDPPAPEEPEDRRELDDDEKDREGDLEQHEEEVEHRLADRVRQRREQYEPEHPRDQGQRRYNAQPEADKFSDAIERRVDLAIQLVAALLCQRSVQRTLLFDAVNFAFRVERENVGNVGGIATGWIGARHDVELHAPAGDRVPADILDPVDAASNFAHAVELPLRL